MSQIPQIVSTIQGRGNNIKTHIVNINEIADLMHTTPERIIRFLSGQMGCYPRIDVNSKEYHITGAFTSEMLQTELAKFN